MVGIIYNTQIVHGKPTSWASLWEASYSGQILTFNNPRDAFGTAMYKMGIDVNTTNSADWQKALDSLKAQKPLVQGYVMDEIFNKMKNGSAAIAPYYAGDFFTMYADNPALSFYYPTEGTNVFVDAMCVPKNAENPELAELFINFMLEPEVGVSNSYYIGYASPNSATVALLDEETRNNETIIPNLDSLENCEVYQLMDADTTALMDEYWKEIKAE